MMMKLRTYLKRKKTDLESWMRTNGLVDIEHVNGKLLGLGVTHDDADASRFGPIFRTLKNEVKVDDVVKEKPKVKGKPETPRRRKRKSAEDSD